VEKHRSEGTYSAYKVFATLFIDEIGELPMADLTPESSKSGE